MVDGLMGSMAAVRSVGVVGVVVVWVLATCSNRRGRGQRSGSGPVVPLMLNGPRLALSTSKESPERSPKEAHRTPLAKYDINGTQV